MKPSKKEIVKGWAIWNDTIGLYVGWFVTKKGMIYIHCNDSDETWKVCQENGDRAVKIEISVKS